MGINQSEALHPSDVYQWVTNKDHANTLFSCLKEFQKEHGLENPQSKDFLGLGCGGGISEIEMASLLRSTKVTLVDKHPQIDLGLNQDDVRFNVVTQDLFTYLSKIKDTNQKFGYISAFGLEYLLKNQNVLENFLKLVSEILTVNGIIFLYPIHLGIELNPKILKKLGIRELIDDVLTGPTDSAIRLFTKE